MERDLDQLAETNEQNRQTLQRDCLSQYQQAVAASEVKRQRMKWRWSLEQAIERKKLELKTGDLYGPLPEITFPEIEETREEVNDLLEKYDLTPLTT